MVTAVEAMAVEVTAVGATAAATVVEVMEVEVTVVGMGRVECSPARHQSN